MAATQARSLPAEVQRARQRLLVDQGPTARSRNNYLDTPALRGYIGNHAFSSRRISIRQMYEMQTDAIIAFATLVSMIPLFMAKWRIECASARKAQFLDNALRRIYGRWVIQACLSWYFGYQALVKNFALTDPGWKFINKDAPGGPTVQDVWDGGPDVPALVWEPFTTLRPESVLPIYTQAGAFDGIRFDGSGSYSFPSVPLMVVGTDGSGAVESPNARKVDIDHALWVTNQRDGNFGSVWGAPRTMFAFEYWWAYKMTLAVLTRSTERKGDPVVVVRFPQGSSVDLDGTERKNQDIAFEIGEMARSGSVLIIPSDVYDTEDAGKGVPKWGVDYLKAEEKFSELKEILGYLDVAKFRAMMVSELSVAEGSGGTSSRNVAAETGTRTAEAQIFTQVEHDALINQYLLPQLADENFPEDADKPAIKVTQTFGDDEAQLAKDVFSAFANANSGSLPIDWGAMAERFGMPTLSLEGIAEFQKRLENQSTQQQPPPTPAPANGPAGVDQTGFYYDSRERIDLEDSALLASLPQTKHYEDKAVLAHTRLIRGLWADLFHSQYEDFAKHLEQAKLAEVALANEKDPEAAARKAAEQIVSGWKFGATKVADVVKRTAQALSDIFDRAGRLELKRASLAVDGWDPSEKELADWVKSNAASMVKIVGEATRKQLSSFLYEQVKANKSAPEMAVAVREHFSDFPGWRADRLARTEVRRFYNAATAFAAQAAGAQIQMLDARKGPTDATCEHRNGKIVSPQEFLAEDAKEHPNGTLAGRILKSKVALSIVRVGSDDAEGYAARVDRESGTIYLREDLDEEQEGSYLEQVGQWFEMVPDR